MKKAVEWLVEQLYNNEKLFMSGDGNVLDDILEQAKEMEKNQIIDAYLKDRHKVTIDKAFDLWNNAEQYYNETFKDE